MVACRFPWPHTGPAEESVYSSKLSIRGACSLNKDIRSCTNLILPRFRSFMKCVVVEGPARYPPDATPRQGSLSLLRKKGTLVEIA